MILHYLCVLVSLLAMSTGAFAQSSVDDRLVIDDRASQSPIGAVTAHRSDDGPLSLEQALATERAGGFLPLDLRRATATNFGLTDETVWLRIAVVNGLETPQRRLLEVAHPSLDYLDLFVVRDEQEILHQQSGDRLPFSARPFPHRHHVFDLTFEPREDYQLYLRVESAGTLTVPMTFWQPQALWRADQSSYALLGLYFGLILVLVVWNLFLYLSLRDPLYLIYVAFGTSLALGQAALAGLSGQYIWPDSPGLNNMMPAALAIAGVSGALFVQRFLGAVPRSLGLHWIMPALCVAYLFTLLSALFWSYRLAALTVNLTNMVFVFSAMGMGAVSLWRGEPGARFFVVAWVALLLGVLVLALHNFGLLPSTPLTANALLIGSSAEMMLLSLALADRINELQEARDEAQAEALRTREELLAREQEHRRSLADRVAERTRELEETNRQLQQSQALLEHQASHDVLTGLVNRKLLEERLRRAESRSKRHQSRFALLVLDLDHFKSINDTLGHVAGDTVLVEVAMRLLRSVRDSDTVARVGGDEFILLIESVRDAADVEQLREKLMITMVPPVQLRDGREVPLSVSVGGALYPDDSGNPDELFDLADRAMYRHKRANKALADGSQELP